MGFLFGCWLNVLLILGTISLLLEVVHADPVWIFFGLAFSIISLAGLLGTATEQLTARGAGIGGLLNASLGTPRN